MVIVWQFLVVVFRLVFNIISKACTGKSKIGFSFAFESGVEGILNWSKPSNNDNAKKGGGFPSTTEVKSVSRTFPKVKGWNEYIGVMIGASSR